MRTRRSRRLLGIGIELVPTAPVPSKPNDVAAAAKKRARDQNDIDPSTEANNGVDAVATNKPLPERMKRITSDLDHFPSEIIQEIFARDDDIGLLYLAEMTRRFADIARIVFGNRYAKNYFIINGKRDGGDPKVYLQQLKHFGGGVKAIQMTEVH